MHRLVKTPAPARPELDRLATARRNVPTPAEIEDAIEVHTHCVFVEALKDLDAAGIRVGAVVENTSYGRTYRITSFQVSSSNFGINDDRPIGNGSLYAYGNLLRADGTWGVHEHSCGSLRDLRPNPFLD